MALAITDIKILSGQGAVPPQGYEKISVDLNKGANGAWLWLAYNKNATQQASQYWITALNVIGKNDPLPLGWIKDPTDLNDGTNSNPLYLIYKKGGSASPITDIQIKESLDNLPAGYIGVNRDLNQGAGGAYLYLVYLHSAAAIPNLVGGENLGLTMGPTDYTTYINPNGTKKAVMVFVDFPDTRQRREAGVAAVQPAANTSTADESDARDEVENVAATPANVLNTPLTTAPATATASGTALAAPTPYQTASAAEMGSHLLGAADQAKTIFRTQSYSKFELDVTVKSDLGWKLLSNASTAYVDGTSINVTKLLTEVKDSLFNNDVTFTDYAMTFVVQPKEAIEINPGTSYGFSPSYPTLDAVVFGADSYSNRYVNLVHEVGHQIGLPDLYPYGNNGATLSEDFRNAGVVHPVGCWSIMADMQHSESFLGWERHKMGWLDDSRKLYLSELSPSPIRVTLNPLTDSSGLSMIVIPLGNALAPSRVFVIEIGQNVYGVQRGQDGKLVRDGSVSDIKGVLLYTVDANVATGALPVKIIPKTISKSERYGELFEAPYSHNDSKTYKDGDANVEIKVTVYKKDDSTYMVDITKNATTD